MKKKSAVLAALWQNPYALASSGKAAIGTAYDSGSIFVCTAKNTGTTT